MSTGLSSLYPKKKDYLDPKQFDTRGPVTQSMTVTTPPTEEGGFWINATQRPH